MPILDPFEDVVQFHRPRGFESRFSVFSAAVNVVAGLGVPQLATFDTAVFDTLNEFDLATETFTPSEAGYYYFHACIGFPALPVGTYQTIFIIHNITNVSINSHIHDGVGALRSQASRLLYLVPTDTVTVNVAQNSGVNQNSLVGRANFYFSGRRVS